MIARRYGCLPSELIERPIESFQFDQLVAATGISEEARQQQKAQRQRDRARLNARRR